MQQAKFAYSPLRKAFEDNKRLNKIDDLKLSTK